MRPLLLATAAMLAFTLTACGGDDDGEAAPTISDADRCAPKEDSRKAESVTYTSDESSLSISADTFGVEGQLNALSAIVCVVTALDGPDSISERVGATTGVAGPQSEDWGDFEANWSFSGADKRLLFTVDQD